VATTRGKFQLTGIQHTGGSVDGVPSRRYTFAPRYDQSIPEDQNYAKSTPAGELWLLVDNPAVNFELGQQYYLDITPADDPAT
jgi:hypothetical protein